VPVLISLSGEVEIDGELRDEPRAPCHFMPQTSPDVRFATWLGKPNRAAQPV
jgi:hypothetical protein